MRDYIFKRLLFLCSLLVLLICGGMVYSLVSGAVPAFEKFGFFHFISSVEWDPRPGNEQYGALAFITGTIMTSFLALVFCIPFSLPVALFTGEYFRGTRAATIIGSVIDLLAGIPSIVYGLWGFYTLRPFMVDLQLSEQGFGIFTAAVVLAVMIIPYASSLSAEFISMVPKELKEGAYSLGGTRLDVIRRVIFPVAGFRNIRQLYPGLRKSIGRDDGSHDADRQYQYPAYVFHFYRQHDGQCHRQPVRRSRRPETQFPDRYRSIAIPHHRYHQFHR